MWESWSESTAAIGSVDKADYCNYCAALHFDSPSPFADLSFWVDREASVIMCGILAVLGCVDNSQAKRARIIELSRRSFLLHFFISQSFSSVDTHDANGKYTLWVLDDIEFYICFIRYFTVYTAFYGSCVVWNMVKFFHVSNCRLRHRGPDWSGLHCFENSYLAHQRLAIVDPTSGDQPLYNEDKTIVVTVRMKWLTFLHIYLLISSSCPRICRGSLFYLETCLTLYMITPYQLILK